MQLMMISNLKHHTWQQQLMSSGPHTVHQQLYHVLLRLPHLKYCRMAMPYHHMRLDASLGELKPGSTAWKGASRPSAGLPPPALALTNATKREVLCLQQCHRRAVQGCALPDNVWHITPLSNIQQRLLCWQPALPTTEHAHLATAV
jgi:hypothetical protein